MGEAVKMLFGGSSSKQQSQATSTPIDMTPAAFKALQQPFANALSAFMSSGGPSYEGPLTASLGANEQTLLNTLMGQTGPQTSRNQLLEKTLGGGFLPGQPGANPFLQAAIEAAQRPTFQALEETLSRALPGRFTAQGGQFVQPQGTSAFDRAAAIATRGATQEAGDIATRLSAGAYESERGRQQEAVKLSQDEVQSTVTNLQAQALPRLIQDQGIERGLAEFQRRTSALLEVLKVIGGVTAPTIANQQSSTSTGTASSYKGIFPNGISGLPIPGMSG